MSGGEAHKPNGFAFFFLSFSPHRFAFLQK